MVRLRKVRRGGRTVWEEIAPEQCERGHRGAISPGRSACPVCDEPVRSWTCWADECDAPTMYDDEHQHHSRR